MASDTSWAGEDWLFRQPSYPVGAKAGITAMFALTAVFEVVCGVWYWRRRHTDVIAARTPAVMLATLLCGLFGTLLEVLPPLWDTQFYCRPATRPAHWLRTLLFMGEFALPFWCCLTLIRKFETQRLRLGANLREQGFEETGLDANWFQRNVALLTSRWTAALLMAWSLLPVVAEMISPLDERILRDRAPDSEDVRFCFLRDNVFNATYLALVVACLLLSFKIRSVQDAFHITFELKVLGALCFSHVLVTWSLLYVFPRYQDSLTLDLYYAVFYIPLTVTAFCMPLRYSYRKLRAQPTNLVVPPEFETLAGVLASKPGRASFQTHLMHEFSLESLLFLTDVDEFRKCKPAIEGVASRRGTAHAEQGNGGFLSTPPHGPAPAPTPAAAGANRESPTAPLIAAASAGFVYAPALSHVQRTAASLPSSPHASMRSLPAHASAAIPTSIAGSTAAIGSAAPLGPANAPDVYLTTEQARDRAIAIYKKYVAKNAPFEINLSHRIASVLHRELGGASPEAPNKTAKTAVGGSAFRRHSMAPLTSLAFGTKAAPVNPKALVGGGGGGGGSGVNAAGPNAAALSLGLGGSRSARGAGTGGAAASNVTPPKSQSPPGAVAAAGPTMASPGLSAITSGRSNSSASPTFAGLAAVVDAHNKAAAEKDADADHKSTAAASGASSAGAANGSPAVGAAAAYAAPATPPVAVRKAGPPLSPLQEGHTPPSGSSPPHTPVGVRAGPPGPATDGAAETPKTGIPAPSSSSSGFAFPQPPASAGGATTVSQTSAAPSAAAAASAGSNGHGPMHGYGSSLGGSVLGPGGGGSGADMSVAIDVKAPAVKRAFGDAHTPASRRNSGRNSGRNSARNSEHRPPHDDHPHSGRLLHADSGAGAGAGTAATAGKVVVRNHSSDGNERASPANARGAGGRKSRAGGGGNGRAGSKERSSISSHGAAPMAVGPAVERTAEFYLTIFDAARDDVWGLLEADSFVRYQNGPLFVQLVQSVALLDQLNDRKPSRKTNATGTGEASRVISLQSSHHGPGGAEMGRRPGTRKTSVEVPGAGGGQPRHILVHGSQKALLSPHGPRRLTVGSVGGDRDMTATITVAPKTPHSDVDQPLSPTNNPPNPPTGKGGGKPQTGNGGQPGQPGGHKSSFNFGDAPAGPSHLQLPAPTQTGSASTTPHASGAPDGVVHTQRSATGSLLTPKSDAAVVVGSGVMVSGRTSTIGASVVGVGFAAPSPMAGATPTGTSTFGFGPNASFSGASVGGRRASGGAAR